MSFLTITYNSPENCQKSIRIYIDEQINEHAENKTIYYNGVWFNSQLKDKYYTWGPEEIKDLFADRRISIVRITLENERPIEMIRNL
jgi:hypothetical protein